MLRRLSKLLILLSRCHSQQSCVRSWSWTKSKTRRMTATIETLNFDNKALRELPIDPETENRRRQVSDACFSKVKPTPVKNPQLVAVSPSALQLLDLDPRQVDRPDFAEYFSGNRGLPGADPAAHCYCGHQFGSFAGQLGDGAAMYLGEVVNKAGERWEIQFKGAGLTPYSRQADGRKVLRSSIREFLCSEAMHHLGIPTTRAGTCVTSDSTVIRDIFYNGNPIQERCTVVLRIAPTFLRFGSFEIFKPIDEETGRSGPSFGRVDILKTLLNYTASTFYPEIWTKYENGDQQDMYISLFREIVLRTARLVAEWQCVGWCHGVLNTDNMSVVGVTMDYGPFAFMDRYDPAFICNGSDDGGRYSYEKQPEICKWNCEKLAEAIQGVVNLERMKAELPVFDMEFNKHYLSIMRKKFGLLKQDLPEDEALVKSFLHRMEETGADFTNSFRCLSRLPLPGSERFETQREEVLEYLLSQCSTLDEVKNACKPRMERSQLQIMLSMIQMNPALQQALGKGYLALKLELERIEKSKKLEGVTQDAKSANDRHCWDEFLSEYTKRLQVEVEAATVQQQSIETANRLRLTTMNSVNPRVVLRNYIAESAIDAAEKGDFSEVQRVLKIIERPYDDQPSEAYLFTGETNQLIEDRAACQTRGGSGKEDTHVKRVYSYDGKPPDWSLGLRVT